MPKAVLDTVVLVRASKRAQSEAARILLAWVEGQFALIISPAILEEYRRVLF